MKETLVISAVLEGGSILAEVEEAIKQPDIIKQFLAGLPEKALQLGIRILMAFIFFLIGVQIIKIVRKIIHKSMVKARVDKGAVQFVDSFIKAALYVLLTFMIASSFGVDAASIVALIGSAGVAIGLAIQGSLSNLAGGVLLLILKPFVVGDYIVSESGHEGTVEEIQMFYTKLVTPDNKVIVLPNGSLANNSLVNATATQTRRMDIVVGISYQSDLKLAKQVLMKVLEEDTAVLSDQDRNVYVSELADSCVRMGIRCWMKKEDFWEGKWRLNEKVKYALDEAGIRFSLPRLEVHMQEADGK